MYLKKELTSEDRRAMAEKLRTQVRLSNRPVCDFCGGSTPVCVYANQDMSTGAQVPCWRWCACKDCSAALDAGKLDVVKARIRQRLHLMAPTASEHFLTTSVDQAWRIFKPIEAK